MTRNSPVGAPRGRVAGDWDVSAAACYELIYPKTASYDQPWYARTLPLWTRLSSLNFQPCDPSNRCSSNHGGLLVLSRSTRISEKP